MTWSDLPGVPLPHPATRPRLADMDKRSRRLTSALPILALAFAACGPGGATSGAGIGDTPAPTPIPSAGSVKPGASGPPSLSQTETTWGTIWDGVPTGFPRHPGSTSADDATAEPVSDVYAIPAGDPAQIAAVLQTTMETATYSTEGLSGPLEDGSYVLDSVGEGGCRIQTRIVPQGGLILVMVLYGADCPAA